MCLNVRLYGSRICVMCDIVPYRAISGAASLDMFIWEEQKARPPSSESQDTGFHGDTVSSKRFYSLQRPTFIRCTSHIHMYTAVDHMYFMCANQSILCTNLK